MRILDPKIDVSLVPKGSKPVIIGARQHEYQQLPSIVTPDARVITRWRPSLLERQAVMRGEDIFVTMIIGEDAKINPFLVRVGLANWTKENG